ncbi:MAG: acyltransferase [Planctomycetota bacterium]
MKLNVPDPEGVPQMSHELDIMTPEGRAPDVIVPDAGPAKQLDGTTRSPFRTGGSDVDPDAACDRDVESLGFADAPLDRHPVMTGAPDEPPPRIHESAIIEPNVALGAGTSVWDAVHIRRGSTLGHSCIVGEKTYIAYDVTIGDLCKINACVYVCAGVTIEAGVMIAAHTVFTNDVLPRATDPDVRELRDSAPDEHTLETTVRRGATIGANCTIGPGLDLGAFCMVGMGSVVTRDVPAHALVRGNPARLAGAVCACGSIVAKAEEAGELRAGSYACGDCGRTVAFSP